MTIEDWAKSLGRERFDLWREAMATLRQMHGDVWNGVRFFLTVNGILLAGAVSSIASQNSDLHLYTAILLGLLTAVGIFVTVIARQILGKHRDYYLEMLMKKTLIEKEFGFYDQKIMEQNLSFPWNVPTAYINDFLNSPAKWVNKQKTRRGTISRKLFLVYDAMIAIWILFFFGIGVWVHVSFCG